MASGGELSICIGFDCIISGIRRSARKDRRSIEREPETSQIGTAFHLLVPLEVVMNLANTPIAKAPESSASASPSILKSGTRSEAGKRFGSVVLPHLADAYSLARWLTGNHADS